MRKAETRNVTAAKAGVCGEKLDSCSFDLAQDEFRRNDKYYFRNRNYLSSVSAICGIALA